MLRPKEKVRSDSFYARRLSDRVVDHFIRVNI